ncbi:MAG: endonuclease/exonuclease/phosphatase family protein [Muribaculaceae bacterium]|nr:endonuclease/exonuclease/phosphatase family protein [Muribaculaceae bacterium]
MARKKESAPASTKATPKRRGLFARFFRGVVIVFDIVIIGALILTAYSGHISPLQHGGFWGILPLCFPACLLASLLMLTLHLFWNRRGALVILLGIIVCIGPILNFSPLNFSKPKIPDGAETFTFLSYNSHQFLEPHTKWNKDTINNATLDYIINTDADIVCLQEATYLSIIKSGYLSRSQANRLHEIYPYVHFDCRELAFLSKFPVEPIHLETNNPNMKGGNVACYRVTMPSGRLITFFNVHLQSFRLQKDDRDLYMGLTEFKSETFEDVKEHLLSKISKAAVKRAQQIQQLLRYIRLYGGPDVIIAGDFNDVPGCYSLHTLESVGFRSVYPEVGLGPIVTYNDQRLYFCIDHTLCRGAIRPVSMKKGRLRSSDHYPLTTQFYIAKEGE